MMKAILFSIGTRGDMEPFLAIAELLAARGWKVKCVFPEQFRDTVEDLGYEFEGYSREFLDMLESQEGKMVMGGQGSFFKRFLILAKMSKTGIRLQKDMVKLQDEILRRDQPDRIFYHPKCAYSLVWGMNHPNRSVMVSPIPCLMHPIKHLTITGAKITSGLGQFFNYKFFNLIIWFKALMTFLASKKYLTDGTGKVSISTIKNAMLGKEKTLYAISSYLFPRPDYWHESAKVAGYHERNKMIDFQPDEKLLNFIQKNKDILLISFGSMSNSDPIGKTKIIVEVLEKNNIPAIISTSWGGLEKLDNTADHIFFIDNIPYDWIFPKMKAIVHHGGSGTTHTALKYGKPSLIIPHIFDQFYWNTTHSDLQLGPKGKSIKNLNEQDFESKLLDLLNNEEYYKNALKTSEHMSKESDSNQYYEMLTS